MDINGSNIKPQTGGLKLMTVFIAVLALHVVVIGGFTVYHLMSGGSDTDVTTTDKLHKGLGGSVSDGTQTDGSQPDKSAAATSPDVTTIPATTATPTPTPAAEATTPAPAATAAPAPDATTVASATSTSTPAPTPASNPGSAPAVAPTPQANLTAATPTAAPAPAPATEVANPGYQAPSGPISPDLAPPPEPAPVAPPAPVIAPAPAPAPASSLASGPVHMPPAVASTETPHAEHHEFYIVKITDSYPKIAKRHHITVAQLKEANHIKGSVLHTGQKLIIPSEKNLVAESAPSATASLASAPSAPVFNESAAPMTTGLTSTSTTVASTGHHHLYTVVKGDTLTKIAHRYRTTASAIMAENGITDPTKLSIGKKLRIPSSEETRSARNTPPASPQAGQVQAKTNAPTAQLANYGN